MTTDEIQAIGIDAAGFLWIKPATETFPHVYRAAMGVQWDGPRRRLFGPNPRDWSYPRWYRQILNAVESECGVRLVLTPATVWTNIDAELQRLIANER
jgi:Integron Cassette Protein Hfx_Cass5